MMVRNFWSTTRRSFVLQLTDELALVISGTAFERGVGSLKMNLTCNDMMTWTTNNGYAVPLMSCGIKIREFAELRINPNFGLSNYLCQG